VNIFFDVDETILGYDGSLRPLVAEVFARLVEEGHHIYVWSGVRTGDIIRTQVVERYGLQPYVTDCFRKPLFDYLEQWRRLGAAIQPEFCVDDYPDIVEAFGGVLIKPYTAAATDADMERVYAAIQTASARIAQDGHQRA
jgi:FMN phosphatase YigB (HAD superfamily)